MSEIVYLNGEFLPAAEARIPVLDRESRVSFVHHPDRIVPALFRHGDVRGVQCARARRVP